MTTLVAKIAQASQKVGALKPDKRNTQQNYDYISADKMLERAGDALAEVGVVVFPSITSEETVQVDYTDNYGKQKSRFDCVVHFGMVISDGDKELAMPWCGRGSDYVAPDKALYKAITSGHKYFLMKLLNVGVGNEDGEHEVADEQDAQEARRGAQPPRMVGNTTGAPKDAPRPAAPATEDDAPTNEEHDVISQWSSPIEAQSWAIMVGACANEHEARNSFKHVVDEHGGGRFTTGNKDKVYLAWVRKCHAKLTQKIAA